MASIIQLKRGTAAAWTSANTVLSSGELGFETDTKKIKVGDGTTAWTSLDYIATDGDISSVVAGTGLSGGGTSGAVTLNLSTPVAATNGGTGLSTFTTGDLPYASATNTLSKLGIGSTGQVLTVSGGVPSWGTSTASSFSGCFVAGVTQTIPNNTFTMVSFASTEIFDTHNYHSTVTNPSRITIPSGKAGYYWFYANIPWQDWNIEKRELRIYKNGVADNSFYSTTNTTSGNQSYWTQTIMGYVNASVGDYFEVGAIQATGGSIYIYGDSGAGNLPGLRFGCNLIGV